jgi:hypothetical protein
VDIKALDPREDPLTELSPFHDSTSVFQDMVFRHELRTVKSHLSTYGDGLRRLLVLVRGLLNGGIHQAGIKLRYIMSIFILCMYQVSPTQRKSSRP